MAYMSQERKKEIAPLITAVLKKYNVKGSLSVRNLSTLVCTIKESAFFADVNGDYTKTNPYWLESNYKGTELQFLKELKDAMMTGNHNNSDLMTDYHDVGWYIDISIGSYKTNYKHNPDLMPVITTESEQDSELSLNTITDATTDTKEPVSDSKESNSDSKADLIQDTQTNIAVTEAHLTDTNEQIPEEILIQFKSYLNDNRDYELFYNLIIHQNMTLSNIQNIANDNLNQELTTPQKALYFYHNKENLELYYTWTIQKDPYRTSVYDILSEVLPHLCNVFIKWYNER